jgi:hypothetical protein
MWGLLPPIFLSKYFVNIWWLQTKADRPKPKTFFLYFFRLKKGKSFLTGTFFYSVINRSKIVFWPSSHQLMYFCCQKLKAATRNKSMFTIQIAKTMKILIQFAKKKFPHHNNYRANKDVHDRKQNHKILKMYKNYIWRFLA